MASSPIQYHPLHRNLFQTEILPQTRTSNPYHTQHHTALEEVPSPQTNRTWDYRCVHPKKRRYEQEDTKEDVIAKYKSAMFNPDLYVAVISKMFSSDGTILTQGPALNKTDLAEIVRSLIVRYTSYIRANKIFSMLPQSDQETLLKQNVPLFIQLIMAKVQNSRTRFEQLCHLVGSDGNVSKFPELSAMSFEYFCSSTEFLNNNVNYERQYLVTMIQLMRQSLSHQNLALLANLIPFYAHPSTRLNSGWQVRTAFLSGLNLIQSQCQAPIRTEEVENFFSLLDDLNLLYPTM